MLVGRKFVVVWGDRGEDRTRTRVPYKVEGFKLRRLPPRSGATVTEDSHDFSWGEMTNPGRVLCLQALYFPILQHRGTHTHPMPIRLHRGSTPQSLPVSFTAPSDVSAISELPRHHRDLGPRTDCADPSALGSDRRDRLGAIFR